MSSTVSTPLSGLRLGISISSSPDLARLGLGELHLQDAFVEITRYLLASGGSPAYGGDLRKGGYTDLLLDLLRTYRDEVPEVVEDSRSAVANEAITAGDTDGRSLVVEEADGSDMG